MKNYKERRHQKPKVKGPSQERRINYKTFKAFAKAWAQKFGGIPSSLPEGYTERDYCRAAGIETRLVAVPVNRSDVMARRVPK